jgi:hypothetical protein
MVFGMTLATYTLVHVVLSLIGIAAGLVVMYGLLTGKGLDGWTGLFLATTLATTVTGYGFPVDHLLPSHIVGFVSLGALAAAIAARYSFHLSGGWRRTYVLGAVLGLYLNVFVAVVQSFEKISALHALAPTQSEPPFAIAQLLVLAIFIVVGVLAWKRFRATPALAARAAAR